MADLAPLSHALHKRMMRALLSGADLTPEQDALQYAAFDSRDYREGRAAFLERRPPRFDGS